MLLIAFVVSIIIIAVSIWDIVSKKFQIDCLSNWWEFRVEQEIWNNSTNYYCTSK